MVRIYALEKTHPRRDFSKRFLKFTNILGARKKMYLVVLWICDQVFDADSVNGIRIS